MKSNFHIYSSLITGIIYIRANGSLFKCALLNLRDSRENVSEIADRAHLDVSR